jgi:hypothetical protein
LSFATNATLYEEKNVELVNPSGRPTRIQPPQVTGPYMLEAPFCQNEQDPFGSYLGPDGIVPPNTRCSIRITFRPQTAGSFPGEVVVANDSSPTPERVTLSGEATPTGPIPTITSSSPETGPAGGGTVVRVRGTNLNAVTYVYLGSNGDATHGPYSTNPTFTASADGRSLTFRTVAQNGDARGRIILSTATGISVESPQPFTYALPGAPAVTAVTPASIPERGGVRVRVTGTDLSFAEVFLDGQYVPREPRTNDGVLIFVAPAHAPGPAQLLLSGNGDAPVQTLTYTATPAPAITALTPATGPAGGNTAVRLTGTDLTGTTSVTVGGATVPFTLATNRRALSFRTPAHAAGDVPVVVTTPAGASAPASFTYTPTPAPVVTALSPTEGPARGSTAVRATGTDLVDVQSVTVGGASVPFTAATNGRSLSFRTPAHAAGTVPVVVTTPSGTSAPVTFGYR